MDALRFDRIAQFLSRRGLVSLIGAGLLIGRVPDAPAKGGVGSCGGQPTKYTKYCPGIRFCEVDTDCADGCACIERKAGCCYAKRRKRGKPKKRRCVDFFTFLCTPRTEAP